MYRKFIFVLSFLSIYEKNDAKATAQIIYPILFVCLVVHISINYLTYCRLFAISLSMHIVCKNNTLNYFRAGCSFLLIPTFISYSSSRCMYLCTRTQFTTHLRAVTSTFRKFRGFADSTLPSRSFPYYQPQV